MKNAENKNGFIAEESEESEFNNQEYDQGYYDSVGKYLASISEFPVLSKNEVAEIYQVIQSQSASKTIKQAARDTLINCNLKLVWSRVKKIIGNTYNPFFLEAIEEGNLVLIEKVIPKFDPNKEYEFSSYATPVIDEAIRKAIACNNMSMFKKGSVPRFTKVKQIFQQLETEKSTAPSLLEELNKELKNKNIKPISKTTFNALFIHTEQGKLPHSLDEKPENGLSRYETIDNQDATQNFINRLAEIDFQQVAKKVMMSKFLTKREIDILFQTYHNNKSLREVAEQYNLTSTRIDQILKTALNKLSKKMVSLKITKEDLPFS